jgi:hypothetical protein
MRQGLRVDLEETGAIFNQVGKQNEKYLDRWYYMPKYSR